MVILARMQPGGPSGTGIGRGERIAFGAAVLAAWTYVVLRAFLVPVVHDEARTFFLFNEVGSFQPWYCFPDAANHLLNTALGQVAYLLFGPYAWALRLFNVLGFLVYAWYVSRLAAAIRYRVIRVCLVGALLFMPFGIEFFGLYRGYGLGMAFWVMALHHLFRFSATGRYGHLVGVLVGLMLATYADLSLLVLWCAVSAYLAVLFLRLRVPLGEAVRRWATWCILGLLPLIYLAAYAMELSRHGAFYQGSDEGLVQGTLASLCLSWFASNAPWLVLSIAGLLSLAVVQGVVVCIRRSEWIARTPIAILVQVVLVEAVGRSVLAQAFGMPYPTDRTALHLFVLVPLLLAFAMEQAAGRARWARWSAVVLLALPCSLFLRLNVDRTTIWADQAISEGLFDRVAAHPRPAGRPPVIGASTFLFMPWAFRNLTRDPALPAAQEMLPGTDGADLLLVPVNDLPQFPSHELIAKEGEVALCSRRIGQRTVLLLDTVLPSKALDEEFTELWSRPRNALPAEALIVDLELVLSAPGPLKAWLLCSEDGASADLFTTRALDLLHTRTQWHHDTLRATRWLPLLDDGSGLAYVRLWNRSPQGYLLEGGRLRIHRVVGEDTAAE